MADAEVDKGPAILPEVVQVQIKDNVATRMQTRFKTKVMELIRVDLVGMLYTQVEEQERTAVKIYGLFYPNQHTLRKWAFETANAEDEQELHNAYLKWEAHC